MNKYSLFDLQAWKVARDLRIDIAKVAKAFPPDEKYRLYDQIVRSSRSVVANISEGFGRFHYKESIQYYRQARGSLIETIEHLVCAYDENYIAEMQLKELLERVERCTKLINGLIRSQSQHAKK